MNAYLVFCDDGSSQKLHDKARHQRRLALKPETYLTEALDKMEAERWLSVAFPGPLGVDIGPRDR